MKAIRHDRYGPLDGLELRDVDVPPAPADGVLVRVRAVGLSVGDVFAVKGAPFAMRLVTGLIRPKFATPGFDFAGTIEAVGDGVTHVRTGDDVFGTSAATCAEFATAEPEKLAIKPSSLSFEEAAVMPTSASAALHGLRDAARVQAGQSVLIIGASGGIGTFAVQIAKWLGATVTGVCSTGNVELVRSLGADNVIDYTKDDFASGEQRYDVIFDNIENRSLSDCRRALAPGGTLVLNSGTGAQGINMVVRQLKPIIMSRLVQQNLKRFISRPTRADLEILSGLAESRTLRPLLDRTYPLEETAAALAYVQGGHARGKVVLTI